MTWAQGQGRQHAPELPSGLHCLSLGLRLLLSTSLRLWLGPCRRLWGRTALWSHVYGSAARHCQSTVYTPFSASMGQGAFGKEVCFQSTRHGTNMLHRDVAITCAQGLLLKHGTHRKERPILQAPATERQRMPTLLASPRRWSRRASCFLSSMTHGDQRWMGTTFTASKDSYKASAPCSQ